MRNRNTLGGIGIAILALLVCIPFMIEIVDTGHVAQATRFGKVTGAQIDEGLHIVNPILDWDHFNTLDRSQPFDDVQVPAADQQKATMDISVQYSIRPEAVETLRRETGNERTAFSVHFVPTVRGALRDAGRSTSKVEMFYDDQKITDYRAAAMEILNEELGPVGYNVTDVIVRDVSLPQKIQEAILAKKDREQKVEQERAELERVALQAQQVVKTSEANLAAAENDAQAVKITATAEAFKIQEITRRLTPAYVEFRRVEEWNGQLPRFTGGGAVPFFNIDPEKQ